jgi:uncharacterized protein (DUF427 family)
MGLAWQQGPLSGHSVGRFLTAQPLPERLLYAERLRRRMRVQFGGAWIVDSQDVVLLHEPGHYPVAYFPTGDIVEGAVRGTDRVTRHQDLGATTWFTVGAGGREAERAAWQHVELPAFADVLKNRVAFAWRAMDAFYEEDERILGHAADQYHRIDIRDTSRHLVVRHEGATIADTRRPKALFESGFAPRWYVERDDIDMAGLTPVEGQTFCPYKGLCSYFDIGDARHGAWSYEDAFAEVSRVDRLISFEADVVEVSIDGVLQHLEPGQLVLPHGPDRGLDPEELKRHGSAA